MRSVHKAAKAIRDFPALLHWEVSTRRVAHVSELIMRRVELLFFPGCPHIDAARTQLSRALGLAGLPARWIEHDVTLASTPAALRGYGSPTILIDGADVMGAPPGDGAACRFYFGTEVPGAPPLKDLVGALTE